MSPEHVPWQYLPVPSSTHLNPPGPTCTRQYPLVPARTYQYPSICILQYPPVLAYTRQYPPIPVNTRRCPHVYARTRQHPLVRASPNQYSLLDLRSLECLSQWPCTSASLPEALLVIKSQQDTWQDTQAMFNKCQVVSYETHTSTRTCAAYNLHCFLATKPRVHAK